MACFVAAAAAADVKGVDVFGVGTDDDDEEGGKNLLLVLSLPPPPLPIPALLPDLTNLGSHDRNISKVSIVTGGGRTCTRSVLFEGRKEGGDGGTEVKLNLHLSLTHPV